MQNSRFLSISIFSLFLLLFSTCFIKDEVIEPPGLDQVEWNIDIPPGGNSWVVNQSERNRQMISESGIQNWSNPASRIKTFFRVEETGALLLALRVRASEGTSRLKCTFGGISKEIAVSNTQFTILPIGTFQVDQAGYHSLELQGMSKTGATFAEVSGILLGGAVSQGEVHFVKDDFYWGRRGPSVHLSYEPPVATDVVWFYNEMTIPEGQDVLGSYFMANGFGEGYFGIQVNSPTERRILFSVWSPYKTDNPNEIPEEYKIKLLKKGEDVYTGEFGNEGSGGQSYLRYNWEAGTTYKFLLKGEPTGDDATDYTAYFYTPETGEWRLIASWRRPKTSTYLTRLYSFLENFHTETGHITRRGLYTNQWVYDTNGGWYELTRAKFTADATARKGNRLDYTGGVEDGQFFLKNCGFFSERTSIDLYFDRAATGKVPVINFSSLP